MKRPGFREEIAGFMREIVFGLEDSLVSTLGAVVGIAAGAPSRNIVILSGLVLVVVEAISMAAGSYLSSKSADEAEREFAREGKKKDAPMEHHPIRGAFVMGAFYVLGGCVPLTPFLLLPLAQASIVAVVVTACTLFLVGMFAAWISRRSLVRGGMEMLVVSLSAAGAGYAIGSFVSQYFHISV